MTEERAKRYADRFLLGDSEELYAKLQRYYDLIEASKKSVYFKFISSTDMSVESLKDCIKTEAVMLNVVNENVCIGVSEKDVINSLKPIYKQYKRLVRKHTDKPPFYHVNSLRQHDVFFSRSVSFVPDSFVLGTDGFIRICNDALPLHGLREILEETERQNFCKFVRLTFNDVGHAVIDGREYHYLTDIELRFEFGV